VRSLFIGHGAERTREGQLLRLLRQCCCVRSSRKRLFRGRRLLHRQYRIYPAAGMNACEVDKKGRSKLHPDLVQLENGSREMVRSHVVL
jgi:hypothetical protein